MFPDDQRTSQRFVYEAALKIENCDSGTYTYGRMYNYSAGGIYFESDVALQPGTQVRIDIENPGSESTLKTQVKVLIPTISPPK
jgi:hypothetical protein